MNVLAIVNRLEAFGAALPALVSGVGDDDARFRPEASSWSILEVVTHLADEEVEDFRRRVRLTLEDPGSPWPSIDPEGWARERRYNESDLGESAARFVAERKRSVEWLRGLGDVDWRQAHEHPRLGSMRAGDVLASWAAHDALHLRQIARRMFQLTNRDAGDFTTRYAGGW